MDIENYIKDLSPELQEKARACKSTDELLKLADDNDIELTADTLESVSGGACENSKEEPKGRCPFCGSTHIRYQTVLKVSNSGLGQGWCCFDCQKRF